MTVWILLLLFGNLFSLVLVLITLYGLLRERDKFRRTMKKKVDRVRTNTN